MEYDFEYLKDLYKKDPKEFEIVSAAMINDVIERARPENRKNLRAKQWRLRQELDKINDPLERMNRMVSIFWSGVNDFVKVTKSLNNTENIPIKRTTQCKVIDIKRKSE